MKKRPPLILFFFLFIFGLILLFFIFTSSSPQLPLFPSPWLERDYLAGYFWEEGLGHSNGMPDCHDSRKVLV